jgi:hypothetical protein
MLIDGVMLLWFLLPALSVAFCSGSACRCLVGAAFAFPMNWWLVAHHLKHGILTVRPKGKASEMPGMKQKMDIAAAIRSAIHSPRPQVPVMAVISLVVLAAGVARRAHLRLRPLTRKRCCRFLGETNLQRGKPHTIMRW